MNTNLKNNIIQYFYVEVTNCSHQLVLVSGYCNESSLRKRERFMVGHFQ